MEDEEWILSYLILYYGMVMNEVVRAGWCHASRRVHPIPAASAATAGCWDWGSRWRQQAYAAELRPTRPKIWCLGLDTEVWDFWMRCGVKRVGPVMGLRRRILFRVGGERGDWFLIFVCKGLERAGRRLGRVERRKTTNEATY